jgi:hypothetical protein
MSVELALLLAIVAWILGPTILRFTGNLLALLALLAWAIRTAPHASPATAIATAVVGALMRYTGTSWRARRESGSQYHRVRRRWLWRAIRWCARLGDDPRLALTATRQEDGEQVTGAVVKASRCCSPVTRFGRTLSHR